MTEPTEIPAPDAVPAGPVEQFAAKCAHDFNNLLTGILGNLELMQSRAKRAGVTDFDSYMEGARNAASRAAVFSQRLISFSGRAAGEAEPVAVNPLVTSVVDLMREYQGSIGADLSPQAGSVLCDPAQLEIALTELLNNAREAAGAEGAVSIASRRAKDTTEIDVTDDGPGMAAETLASAATPFFSTRRNGAGKGLGLAIVERFARQTGGRLVLESAPGAGTTARLVLPRRAD